MSYRRKHLISALLKRIGARVLSIGDLPCIGFGPALVLLANQIRHGHDGNTAIPVGGLIRFSLIGRSIRVTANRPTRNAGLELKRQFMGALLATTDRDEGIKALLEKREPKLDGQ